MNVCTKMPSSLARSQSAGRFAFDRAALDEPSLKGLTQPSRHARSSLRTGMKFQGMEASRRSEGLPHMFLGEISVHPPSVTDSRATAATATATRQLLDGDSRLVICTSCTVSDDVCDFSH
jgi:hypothetical protein